MCIVNHCSYDRAGGLENFPEKCCDDSDYYVKTKFCHGWVQK